MPKKRILQDRGLVRVTFELPAEVHGQTIHLVGDFTSWKGVPMERRKDGGWQVSADLEPGRSYEFRYLIDGERWENDWAADRYVRNPFGHENSVIETPPLAAPPATVDQPAGEERIAVDAGTARKAAKRSAAAKKTAGAKKATTRKAATAKKAAAAKKTTPKKAASKKAAPKKAAKKTSPRKQAGPPPDDESDR